MQSLEVSGAVRPIYGSLDVKGLRLFFCSQAINLGDLFRSWHIDNNCIRLQPNVASEMLVLHS